jgi:hypothetical protein
MKRSILLLACLGLGCAASINAPGQKPVYPPSEVEGTSAKCEKICDVHVVATTIESFCIELADKTRSIFGTAPSCKPQGPLGLPTRDEAAVRDAMIVDLIVTSPDDAKYSVIALRTDRGWELAAEIGSVRGAAVEKPDALRVVGARPVDAPGLSPFGVEIRVRIEAQGNSVDKVFVCGKHKDASSCPTAIVANG